MKIAIGADHGGFHLKEMVRILVDELGHEVQDLGCYSTASVDYPDLARLVCEKVDAGIVDRGILICGTGLGMSMAANRYAHVRAALCHDHYTARMSREHNNANVLCMGERVIGHGVAEDIVRIWLAEEFSGGRHLGRIELYSKC
ncbi:MAG: ribose 5-phosphate isomerase B [Proteobacteria bacterium]|nr:ribose 5-phosphate isomerase B [Pseudomonadota bacterium]MBU1649112.1 ribose 5-phosphate isomerase B [Pseudomonadota bacterium]MBU1987037.1 ribose 5-phosphate isomerase B [Pseudomonadota bacterium]